MNSLPDNHSTVIRTERGLTIAGTRTTLYEVMDYLLAKWPHTLIRDRMNLNDAQIEQAITYINSNRDEFEKEYHEVVKYSDEVREYWENKNQELFADIAQQSNKSDLDTVRTQQHEMVLHTGNRRMRGADSLEQTIREENTSTSLPVITVSSMERLDERVYREHCAIRLIEIMIDVDDYRGSGSLFIP